MKKIIQVTHVSIIDLIFKKKFGYRFLNPKASENKLVSNIIVLLLQSAIELLRFHYRTAVSKPTS
jgi:hypothetical protein